MFVIISLVQVNQHSDVEKCQESSYPFFFLSVPSLLYGGIILRPAPPFETHPQVSLLALKTILGMDSKHFFLQNCSKIGRKNLPWVTLPVFLIWQLNLPVSQILLGMMFTVGLTKLFVESFFCCAIFKYKNVN